MVELGNLIAQGFNHYHLNGVFTVVAFFLYQFKPTRMLKLLWILFLANYVLYDWVILYFDQKTAITASAICALQAIGMLTFYLAANPIKNKSSFVLTMLYSITLVYMLFVTKVMVSLGWVTEAATDSTISVMHPYFQIMIVTIFVIGILAAYYDKGFGYNRYSFNTKRKPTNHVVRFAGDR